MSALNFGELTQAVYYWGAFTSTWLVEREEEASELTRRRWLEKHLIERAILEQRTRKESA